MALIYADEFLELHGSGGHVYDARDRLLSMVVACDPLTGEVIEIYRPAMYTILGSPTKWSACPFNLRFYAQLDSYLYKRWGIDIGREIPRIHRFAPAPLIIAPAEPVAELES